tara:strand:+ start:262 stop:1119 length:858 start_codon:yes stop_codon:yes gene_type:complete
LEVSKMSDWLNKFVAEKKLEEQPLVEDELDDELDEEIQDEVTIADVNEILISLKNIWEENKFIVASINALNEELKGGLSLLQNKIDNIKTHTQTQINALDDKVTRSMLAMEDGNEKRALLFAQALEEINDLVADPDQMTDVFKVAPDIAMEAIERDAQGELNDAKPFDPDDEIFLPESVEDEVAKEIAHIPDDEFDERQEENRRLENADPVIEEEAVVEMDELGVGEIQTLTVPEELPDYTEEDYNVVMNYINGEIKWGDMMKHAGGMRAAKEMVDPVKAYMGIE